MEYAVIGLLIAFPVALIYVFKSNAALCFFILLAGALTAQYAVPDLLTKSPNNISTSLATSNVANILFLSVPWILVAIFSAKSFFGKRAYLQLIPAAALALCFTYLISAYLPGEPPFAISSDNVVYENISKYFTQIISVGFLVSLVFLIVLRPKHGKDKKHHK